MNQILDYDIAVATCNRLDALRLSLPLFCTQSRRPRQIIVADASDDHATVRDMIHAMMPTTQVPLQVIEAPRGLTRQRNAALERVQSAVVMFPDDDALWFPDTAERIMTVYERDADEAVGGVAGHDASQPPPDAAVAFVRGKTLGPVDRLKARLTPLRLAFEGAVAPNPVKRLGRRLLGSHDMPDWLAAANAEPIEHMIGFRMSFRTDVVRRCGFDEAMAGYGLYEDYEVSMAVLHEKILVEARDAQVYHHRRAGGRGNGRQIGATLILNLAYVLARHTECGDPLRAMMKRFAWYRVLMYLPRAYSGFGRSRLVGLWRALRCLDELFDAAAEDLSGRYEHLLRRCLAS